MRDRRDEASSEFCVLSSEFETSETGESSRFDGQSLKSEGQKTQNPELRMVIVALFSPVARAVFRGFLDYPESFQLACCLIEGDGRLAFLEPIGGSHQAIGKIRFPILIQTERGPCCLQILDLQLTGSLLKGRTIRQSSLV